MDSDSRMGQGLGQNPGKPEGHFPSEMSFWEGGRRVKIAPPEQRKSFYVFFLTPASFLQIIKYFAKEIFIHGDSMERGLQHKEIPD